MLKNDDTNEVFPLDPKSTSRVVSPTHTTHYTLIVQDNMDRRVEVGCQVDVGPSFLYPPAISGFTASHHYPAPARPRC